MYEEFTLYKNTKIYPNFRCLSLKALGEGRGQAQYESRHGIRSLRLRRYRVFSI